MNPGQHSAPHIADHGLSTIMNQSRYCNETLRTIST